MRQLILSKAHCYQQRQSQAKFGFCWLFCSLKWLLSFESWEGWMSSHRVLSHCHSLGGEKSATHTKTVVSFSKAHYRVRGYFPERFVHKETMLWMAVRAEHFHRFTMIRLWKMCTNWRPNYVWGVLPQFWQILLPPTRFDKPMLDLECVW